MGQHNAPKHPGAGASVSARRHAQALSLLSLRLPQQSPSCLRSCCVTMCWGRPPTSMLGESCAGSCWRAGARGAEWGERASAVAWAPGGPRARDAAACRAWIELQLASIQPSPRHRAACLPAFTPPTTQAHADHERCRRAAPIACHCPRVAGGDSGAAQALLFSNGGRPPHGCRSAGLLQGDGSDG